MAGERAVSMLEELIARVFATRNAAQLEHWRTGSFAQHEALGAFYEAIIGSLDQVVEAHQGIFELVSVGELPRQPRVGDIIAQMEADLAWIARNRRQITSALPAIDNLLQGLESDYMTALYKLKRLS